MSVRVRGHVDYSGCKPKPEPITAKAPGRKKGAKRAPPWTGVEVAKLVELCATMSVKAAAGFITTRTKAAVSYRAAIMGLARKHKFK